MTERNYENLYWEAQSQINALEGEITKLDLGVLGAVSDLTALSPATDIGREEVKNRKNAAEDYRRLLTRWAVAGGREHKTLADLTLAVLGGERYEDALPKVS